MGWLKELGKDTRGSRPRCVLLTDGSPDRVAERLTRMVCRPEVVVSPGDRWRPQGTSDVREAQLDKAVEGGAVLLPESIRRQLREWWLAEGAGRSRTPNWDIASTCSVCGRKGLLLVEAKAHAKELSKGDRCGATPANRERIESALAEANASLRMLTGGSWRLSAEHHYQLSNRFAWSWKLAALGVPVILIYLGFLGAEEMAPDGALFRSEDDWETTLRGYARGVSDDACWGRRIDVNGTPLRPLIRAIDVPFLPDL